MNSNIKNKKTIKKISNLDYVSIKEISNLDKMEILYITNSVDKNDNVFSQTKECNTYKNDNVFSQTKECNTYKIDDIEKLSECVEELFIECVKKNNKIIKIENNNSLDTINNQLSIINKERIEIRKRTTKQPFFLVPINYKIDGYDVIETKYLQTEIIFGYKTEINEPGILIITNEDGLKDKNNLRLSLIDIGFFPDKSYCLLKI
jgi:hypothetical protein